MRTVFLVLLLANLAFFAWSRYLSPGDPATDPQPLLRQVEPERISIIAAGDDATRAQELAGMTGCLEWGGFSLGEAARARIALAPLALGARLSEVTSDETASWWVYLPPQGSREGALKKVSELRELGEEDYYVVPDEGRNRWSVSLGIYRSEEAAQTRLAALRGKGVRSAVVGPRELPVEQRWFQVRRVDTELRTRLAEMAQRFAGTGLRECSANS